MLEDMMVIVVIVY